MKSLSLSSPCVPVIMLHSVGADALNWPYAYLSEDIALFERKIDFLLRQGYQFIFHEELYQYMDNGTALPSKTLMLTFDDGYLDNWVIVYPILKRKGVKFTIYVSQEFVDPVESCRPTFEDVRIGKCCFEDLSILGYLSWSEMRAMESSGLVDIQSHTSTHTWHYTSDKVFDFLTPSNAREYPWIFWNHHPSCKHHWMQDNGCDSLWGLPIYENRRAMVARRYYEDHDLNALLIAHVQEHGQEDFFIRSDWQETLTRLVEKHRRDKGNLGRFETDDEHQARMIYELYDNKASIEGALNKKVDFLCWPGGAYNDDLIDLATKSGYRASTVKRGCNIHGDDPRFVHRISSGNPSGAHRFPWKYPLFTLRFYLDRFRRKQWALTLGQVNKIMRGR